MLEILAPAGNAQCAQAAIDNGANAIYLGYSAFSARQGAENFGLEQLAETVKNAHFCGVNVYVAMNTIVKDTELDSFLQTLADVWQVGVDAIILQDALLGKAIKERLPDVVLHLSTQAGVCNVSGALFAKECGFSRVILARETPLDEIAKITEIIETEVFVQGALCTCFSGQCYFSSFAGGNSGNRGRCKQPCRKQYSINRSGFEERNYALSLADLCVGESIDKLIQAGVVSFKIEGRMRRAEYVAAAVRYYRAILDNVNAGKIEQSLSDLKRTYNRGNYTKGLAFGQDKRFISSSVQGHIGEKVGVVKVVNGAYVVESICKAQNGDAFKILRGGKEVGGAVFGKAVPRGFTIVSSARLKNGDGVFITTDTAVNARVLSAKKRAELPIRLHFCEGQNAVAVCGDVVVTSKDVLQTANNQALTEEQLISCFEKTDGLPIEVQFEEIVLRGQIFIAKSVLNAFRREFYEKIAENIVKQGRNQTKNLSLKASLPDGKNEKIAVISNDFGGVKTDVAVYKPDRYSDEIPANFANGDFERLIYYPPFCTSSQEQSIAEMIEKYHLDGVYAENYAALQFAKMHNVAVFAGTGLHLINRVSIAQLLQFENVRYYALSKEANYTELKGLISEKAFVLSSGDVKVMDLCYCPFEKTCGRCDKKNVYCVTDENGREFPMRRYTDDKGNCRFEVYNCASLIGVGVDGAGKLLDCTLQEDKAQAVQAANDEIMQKKLYKNYTSGHFKRGVL